MGGGMCTMEGWAGCLAQNAWCRVHDAECMTQGCCRTQGKPHASTIACTRVEARACALVLTPIPVLPIAPVTISMRVPMQMASPCPHYECIHFHEQPCIGAHVRTMTAPMFMKTRASAPMSAL
eukprot:366320-Chlamydomonas_euryale.AAC.6